jgi:hypothetical protein
MRYRLDSQGSNPARSKIFSIWQDSDQFWGLTSLLSTGYCGGGGGLSRGKTVGREADQSLPSRAKAKMVGVHLHSPCLHGIMYD